MGHFTVFPKETLNILYVCTHFINMASHLYLRTWVCPIFSLINKDPQNIGTASCGFLQKHFPYHKLVEYQNNMHFHTLVHRTLHLYDVGVWGITKEMPLMTVQKNSVWQPHQQNSWTDICSCAFYFLAPSAGLQSVIGIRVHSLLRNDIIEMACWLSEVSQCFTNACKKKIYIFLVSFMVGYIALDWVALQCLI